MCKAARAAKAYHKGDEMQSMSRKYTVNSRAQETSRTRNQKKMLDKIQKYDMHEVL